MSNLPFTKDNTRKYTCFICGVQFDAFDEYKEHIIDNHELSKDYIICPLVRCGAPVRCLRTHFANNHKSEVCPKLGQMKAIVWRDQNTQTGKLKARRPKFREGYLTSNKNGGKEMHYRSGMECNVYECLESIPEVISYEVEPLKIQYSLSGEIHEYNPDLRIVFDDGRIEIWEIKPSKQTSLPINNAKWTACEQYCEARGYQFKVLTEVGLAQLKMKIRNQE